MSLNTNNRSLKKKNKKINKINKMNKNNKNILKKEKLVKKTVRRFTNW